MKNPMTASERRGILTVAAIALLIIGAGWLLSTCRYVATPPSPPEIETLVNGGSKSNSASSSDTSGSSKDKSDSKSSDKSNSTNKKSKSRKDSLSGSKTKSTKTYRRRSPRDEEV